MVWPIDIWWVWPLWIVFVFGVIAWAVYDDSSWGAFWVLVLSTGAFLLLLSPLAVPVGQWAWERRGMFPAAAAVYLVLGAGWGIIKWYLYALQRARNFESRRVDILGDYRRVPRDVTLPEWVQEFYDFPPSPAKHRGRIVTWMVWWPFSFLDTLLSDLVRRVFDWVYDELAAVLAAISKRAFRRFEELR